MDTKEVLASLLVDGKEVRVSSLDLARFFDKPHDKVMKAIRNLIEQKPEFNGLTFKEVKYTDKKGEQRHCYLMDRDGVTLLAMGFTGAKVLAYQNAFYDAFEDMERSLNDVTAIISIVTTLSIGLEKCFLMS